MRGLMAVAAVLFFSELAGCGVGPRAEDGGTRVTHVVVFWLKNPGNTADRETITRASLGLGEIPGVLEVTTGTPVPSDRPVVDDSFDVALTIVFRDEAALRAYDGHPRHEALRAAIKPLVERLVVYDYR